MTKARNILFLMTDQHRVDTLGAYGNSLARTPVLDELARTGTRFDRWYTPTAICTPARASLLTGQAPFRHKLLANHERNVGYLEDLPDGQFTFSEDLRENGYNCGLIGKWHGGNRKSRGRLRVRRAGPARLAQPGGERGLSGLPDRERSPAVRDQRSNPRDAAERRAGQPARRSAAPAGRGHLRVLPGDTHHRDARAVRGRPEHRRNAVLFGAALLRTAPAIRGAQRVLRHVRPGRHRAAEVDLGDLRRQAAGSAELQRPLVVRHHADRNQSQAHRDLLGLRHADRRADRSGDGCHGAARSRRRHRGVLQL